MKKISIVIISYERPIQCHDLLLNISKMNNLELIEDVIVVNNNSSADYYMVDSFIKRHKEINFRLLKSKRNIGVATARNFGAVFSKAPIILFIDDDAQFVNKNAFSSVLQIFSHSPKLGIASFKIMKDGEMQQTAFPHKRFKDMKNLQHFDAPYFTGCCHALRREVFDKVKRYPVDFFYGMEEYDLGYRVIDAGYTIGYDSGVVVNHTECPRGRLSNKEKLLGMWINKTKVAWRYLPMWCFFTTGLMWSLKYLLDTKDIKGWIKGIGKWIKIPKENVRKKLGEKALSYLKETQARLSY